MKLVKYIPVSPLAKFGLSCATVITTYALYHVIKYATTHCPGPRDILSQAIALTAEKPQLNVATLRSQFSDLIIPELAPPKGVHSHPEAARSRSTGSLIIDRYCSLTGLSAYFIQCSNADLRNGRAGSRSYYWSKDVAVQPALHVPPTNALVGFVDVDHYVDMPTHLCSWFNPVIIYTFQPHQAARTTANYSYNFNEDASVNYQVTGGSTFKHFVWNYGPDHIMATWEFLGITWLSAVYMIDRRPMDLDHEVILLTPVSRWIGPFAYISTFLDTKTLKRLDPIVDKFVRMEIHSSEGVTISTGHVGYYAQATIPAASDNAISSIGRTSKLDLTYPQILSYTDGDREAAAILLEYHKSKLEYVPPMVYPLEASVLRYQFDPPSFDPSAKPSMRPFMSPIIHAAYCPDVTQQNEKQCITGRLERVRSNTTLTPFLNKVMNEFVNEFILDPHSHDPVDDQELYERQNRPTQRRLLNEAEYMLPDRVGKMFLKKEAYAGPKDPRPITTINTVDKAAYSKYIYALADHIKTQPWYAFAKTPKSIAQRVVQLLDGASMAVPTDFSRFDGHYSPALRDLEQMILVRFFRVQYHQDVLDLHRAQFKLKVFSTFGEVYNTEFARGSGSPETAALNTVANAFVAFLALRMSKIDENFIDAPTAYRKLGLYGGDDGLTVDVDPTRYVKAATMVGQELTLSTVSRGDFGIKFLARVYGPNVWFGDENSCCDLPRQLSKFHVTVALPPNVTPVMKLMEKCRAFFLTDANTPVLGWLCNKALTLSPDAVETRFLNIWNSDVSANDQYPNAPCDWYDTYALEVLPEFDFSLFIEWLSQVNRVEDILKMPLCHPFRPAMPDIDVVVNEDVWKAKAAAHKENKRELIKSNPIANPKAVLSVKGQPKKVREKRAKPEWSKENLKKPRRTTIVPGEQTNSPKVVQSTKGVPNPKTKKEAPKQVSTLPKQNGKTHVKPTKRNARSVSPRPN